jgi:PAS domain-containing protein
MPQQPVELILMRQLASYLSVPLLIIGPDERVIYYNEAAEPLVGQPYSDFVGAIMLSDINAMFQITDESGRPVTPDNLPLTIAVREHRPVHARLMGKSLGGEPRHVEITALPLQGQAGRYLGAVAIIWGVDGA